MDCDMVKTMRGKKIQDTDLKKFEDEGVDIGLLLCTLKKTPTERVEDNNEMLRFIDEARKSHANTSF